MKTFLRPLSAAAVAATLLAGCGGSDPGVPDPVVTPPAPPMASNTVPSSALLSAAAYTTFAATLQPSATALPLDVTGVVPPTTETGLPQPI